MVRQYAKYMGIAIVLIGVVGLLLGEQSLLGLLNIDLGEDIVHLATGGLMAYAGFQMRDSAAVRSVVGGLGIVYLLVVVLGVISPTLFGLLPSGYTVVDHLIHAALAAAGIAFGYLLKGATTPAGSVS